MAACIAEAWAGVDGFLLRELEIGTGGWFTKSQLSSCLQSNVNWFI
jgi:hypothetical protein